MRKNKILLVEDHAASAVLLQKLLIRHGCEVSVANNGEQALRLAAEVAFEIVICDMALPDMDGVDLLWQLRRIQPIYSIATTGMVFPNEVQRAIDGGFYRHLCKPLDWAKLRQVIDDISLQIEEDKLAEDRAKIATENASSYMPYFF